MHDVLPHGMKWSLWYFLMFGFTKLNWNSSIYILQSTYSSTSELLVHNFNIFIHWGSHNSQNINQSQSIFWNIPFLKIFISDTIWPLQVEATLLWCLARGRERLYLSAHLKQLRHCLELWTWRREKGNYYVVFE